MSRRWTALLVAIACATQIESRAQQPEPLPEAVDLAGVLKLARDVSPRLSVERQAVAGAEASVTIAGALPNPILSYGRYRPIHNATTLFEGSRQEQGTVELPLLIAGQRSARVEKAERDLDAARARVTSGASSLAAEAGSAFVALLAAQEKAALLSSAGDELARLRNVVAGRESGGMASRYDVLRLDVELAGQTTKLEVARADVSDRSGNLAALLGLKDWRPKATGSLRPLQSELFDRKSDGALESPAVILANREEQAAQSAIELAQRERWPVPSVTAGRSWTSDPYGAANFVGLSVEVPIFDSKRGQVARAEADARAATLKRQIAVAETAANLERYAGVIATRQEALQRFARDVSARLETLHTMAEDAYRHGRTSIFELLDSVRSRQELRQTQIELVAGVLEAQLRFLALRGDLDRAIPGPASR
jgi:cobalt-zinc-cadmium efflux system outer membrane protein